MMRLDELFARKEKTLSFEFFPPKDERSWHTLEDTIDQLAQLGPDFVSVTYGAGGGTRTKTREVIEHIQKKTGVTAMAHLTCVNATAVELKALLDEYSRAGVENILALRGDPPKGQVRFTPTDGGCAYALDLIRLIQDDGRFSTLCAAFPEKHPDAASLDADWKNLQAKLGAGAIAGITQCFFATDLYLGLVDYVERAMGTKPRILPGILPIVDLAALDRFCKICGASVPDRVRELLSVHLNDRIAMRKAGMSYTVQMCRELIEAGAPGLHIYALNRSTAAAEIVTALRLSGHLE